MSLSALVISFGSIGKKHAEVLSEMKEISSVSVLTSQNIDEYLTIRSFSEISKLNPDYIIIASSTSLHYEQLIYLEKKFNNKIILVEKPLFEKKYDFIPRKNKVWVGYLLKCHPVIQKVKELILNRNIYNINIICGSYLPDWRPNRNYKETTSANKYLGGGVLLDLSHELNYTELLFGKVSLDYVYNDKISNLEINSDDILLVNAHTKNGARLQISLSYFSIKASREIKIEGEDFFIKADLINNTINTIIDGQEKNLQLANNFPNKIFKDEHRAIIQDDSINGCTFSEGIKTLDLIEKIRMWPN